MCCNDEDCNVTQYIQGAAPTTYGQKSTACLDSCCYDLKRLFYALAEDGWNISVFCGHRGEVAQTKAYNDGASGAEWGESEHNEFPSKAIDAGPYIPGVGIPWEDENCWIVYAGAVFKKAQEMGIKLKWGGLFQGLKDLNHIEVAE